MKARTALMALTYVLCAVGVTVSGCSDSATIILPDEQGPIDGPEPGDPPVPDYIPDETEKTVTDAGAPQEPLVSEPPVPPPPAWETPLLLIPADEAMVQAFREERVEEFFMAAHGLKVQLLPVGTDDGKGIPLIWRYSEKWEGLAWMRGGCYWTKCYGRSYIAMHEKFKDPSLRFRRRTFIHEIGHIITGLGVKSLLDTESHGHLAQGNLMDPTSNVYYTVLDGTYLCTSAPCRFVNAEDIYVGNGPFYEEWPEPTDAGVPDSGFIMDAGIDTGTLSEN